MTTKKTNFEIDTKVKLDPVKKFAQTLKNADESVEALEKRLASVSKQLKKTNLEAKRFSKAFKVNVNSMDQLISKGDTYTRILTAQERNINNILKAEKSRERQARLFKQLTDKQFASDSKGLKDQIRNQTERITLIKRGQVASSYSAKQRQKALITEESILTRLENKLKRISVIEKRRTNEIRLQESVSRAIETGRAHLNSPALVDIKRQNSVQRVTADGGAALFKIQGQLLGNYLVMNKMFQLMSFGSQFVLELDQAFRQLQAITATTETEMSSLKVALLDVSEQTKFTAVEVAQAATVLGQAGFSTQQIKDSIADITLLATAVGTDLKTAVDLSTSVLSIFNMRAEETGHVANVITGAINGTKLSLEKLSLGLQFAGNTAAQAGATFEETVAVLGAMANAGIRSGSTLGTGLRQVIVSLLNPTKKFIKELNKVGLTVEDVDVKSKGLVNVFATLRDAGFGAGSAFAGMQVRAAAAYLAVSNNIETARELETSLLLSNAAAEANEVQMKSLANTMDQFKSVLGEVIVNLSEPFKNALTLTIKLSSGLLQIVNKLEPLLSVIGSTAIGAGLVLIAHRVTLLITELFSLRNVLLKNRAALRGMSRSSKLLQARMMQLKAVFAAMGGFWTLGITTLLAVIDHFDLLTSSVDKAAKMIDKFKARTSEAQGELDKTTSRIASVSETIKLLNNRYSELYTNSKAIGVETLKAKLKFGQFGLTIDKNKNSVEGLIEGLIRLRRELQGVAVDQLKLVKATKANTFRTQASSAAGATKETIGEGFSSFLTRGQNQKALKARFELPSIRKDLLRLSNLNTSVLNSGQVDNLVLQPLSDLQDRVVKTLIGLNKELSRNDISSLEQSNLKQSIDKFTNLKTSILNLMALGQSIKTDITDEAIAKFNDSDAADTLSADISKVVRITNALNSSLQGVKDIDERKLLSEKSLASSGFSSLKNFDKDKIKAHLLEQLTVDQINGLKASGLMDQVLEDYIAKYSEALANYFNVVGNVNEAASKAAKEFDKTELQILELRKKALLDEAKRTSDPKAKQNIIRQVFGLIDEIANVKIRQLKGATDKQGVTLKQKELSGLKIEALKADAENEKRSLVGGFTGFKKQIVDVTKELEQVAKPLEDIKNALAKVTRSTDLKIKTLQAQSGATDKYGNHILGSTQRTSIANEIRELEKQKLVERRDGLLNAQSQVGSLVSTREAQYGAARSKALRLQGTSAGSDALTAAKAAQTRLNAAKKEAISISRQLAEAEAALAGTTENLKNKQFDLGTTVSESITQWVNTADKQDLGDILKGQFSESSRAFSDFLVNTTNGTKSISQSFKDMALSIVGSLQKVAAEYAASKLFKMGLSFVEGFFPTPAKKATGGFVRAATGRSIKTRDSVPILARPGEFILRNSAVQMIGEDNLRSLNGMGNSRTSKPMPQIPMKSEESSDVVNVYVVSPEQKPTMTPKDVIVTITEDMANGGSTKKLVKSIQLGKV